MSNDADDKYFQLKTSHTDYDNMYHVKLTLIKHDKFFHASHKDRWAALQQVKALCRDWMKEQGLLPESTLDSDLGEQDFKFRTYFNDVANTYTACLEKDGSEFYGYGPTERAAKDAAIKGYHAEYLTDQDKPTARQPTEVDSLYNDLREQEKIMAGLIEKAKRTGLDHRLIAMANTDFERGFMALEKALNTGRVDKYKVESVPC